MKNSVYPLFIIPVLFFLSCKTEISGDFVPSTGKVFSEVRLSGTYYEIGKGAGSHFRQEISTVLDVRKDWFSSLKTEAQADSSRLFRSLLDSAVKYYPQFVDELKGMADGAGISFEDIFILNISAELDAARHLTGEENPGCSTMFLVSEGSKYLIHSEDGHSVFSGKMYLAKVFPPSGVSFVALSYPGIMIGNGPGMNSNGVIQTTNFIGAEKWKKGIPRYFLNRAVLESNSFEDALKICTEPARAFAYRHNLGSFKDEKLWVLEVTPWKFELFEPPFNYCHTNHFLLPSTSEFPQEKEYISTSSMPRFQTLSQEISRISHLNISIEEALNMISSHEKSPYSPCRHPDGEIQGQTLATVVFDLKEKTMTVYKGNPCIAVPEEKIRVFSFSSDGQEW
jgi:isopenicillin-N N-acyltransferase-like protein